MEEEVKQFVVLDLEMTGLNPKLDHIIEVGALRVRGGVCVEELSFFVNPKMQIPQKVMELTGIRQEEVDGGLSEEEAYQKTKEFLGDDILLGHHVIFDYSFLKQLAINRKDSFEKVGIDTLKIARRCLPGTQKKTLEALCEYYQIERLHGHRAIYDCYNTKELYEKLFSEYHEKDPDAFLPKPLSYKAKKQQPASKRQIECLQELLKKHQLEAATYGIQWEQLTRSQASRVTDQILSQFGRD